ncbi:FmdB family zinc ribbon protein [Pararhodospirillum photometricum]|uniref:Putative regulatory protein FmdB zinc ribbon domain-containing protein n=1 Tax=Pararhodospirillum photometricum DSM 122 TaxID=1150469 RepID=H6SMP4_PARPM|nr:zinc ribbon domain-containing protein [Pararhodospirillum photometricum]CCG09179.1 Putative uncharacterized protein [Pararhodospirillum photometricum DSM 122]
MPTYTYHCVRCDEEFSAFVSGSSAAPACPGCGATELERLPAAPAIGGAVRKGLEKARTQAAKEGHFSNYSASEMKGKL